MKTEFFSTHPSAIFESFAENVGAAVTNNSFQLPKAFGKGYASQTEIEDGLFLTIFDYKLNFAVTSTRKPVAKSDFFPIICWLSPDPINQTTDGQEKMVSKNSGNGIFFPSPKIESHYSVPANTRNVILTITVAKSWLQANRSHSKASSFFDLVNNSSSFFIYEDISLEMNRELEQMHVFDTNKTSSSILLRSSVLRFVSLFIEAIEKREGTRNNINMADVDKLFIIKSILSTKYASPPEIKQLASTINMSASKLQKLFKDVFGITIYQFALKTRIEEAKKLLLSKRYSVSEVGYAVGYTNLSHFTSAFKKHEGITPKKFLLAQ